MYRLIFVFLPFIGLSQKVDTISIDNSVMYVMDSIAAVNIINKAKKGEAYERVNVEVDKLITGTSSQKIISDKMQMLLQEQLVYMRSELVREAAKNKQLIRSNETFEKDKDRLKSQRNAFAAIGIVLLTVLISN